MELREWLIILGLALVTLIVIDGIRRLKRQRSVPRLDQDASEGAKSPRKRTSVPVDEIDGEHDPEEAARNAQIDWELPNGGARVVKPAAQSTSPPKVNQERQEPSSVYSDWQRSESNRPASTSSSSTIRDTAAERRRALEEERAREEARASEAAPEKRQEPTLKPFPTPDQPPEEAVDATSQPPTQPMPPRENSLPGELAPQVGEGADRSGVTASDDEAASLARLGGLAADPEDRENRDHEDDERYRVMDFDGMSDSFRSHSSRMGQSVQRFGSSLQKNLSQRKQQRRQEKEQREKEKAERKAQEASRRQQERQASERSASERSVSERQASGHARRDEAPRQPAPETSRHADVAAHPSVEKALRNHVDAGHVQDTLSNAEEVVVISVLARDPQGFSGTALLELMLACGLRYSRDMGIFNRFETEDPDSELQFSVVNVVKPGTFPLDTMDEFVTPGVTLLLPLPGAADSAGAFEAMFETAMVIVRHLGGELKDEQRSVMTAQTVEFARQRVKEFERRHRLHRYQAN
ncbi:cell division protein ZipA [Pistricoccus aurantiacus]|uniref:Cell division protein ZipA n=1 Tax=Pistricoccus aurantiacus TaxID=1883414 RepID=A0A5B8SNR1_9GAMM|nr:cell division protein ZipA [Pistricoccus aurantiacus]QEA37921.1 cell division protein ZipA [Pistricoccus aurantiacus]